MPESHGNGGDDDDNVTSRSRPKGKGTASRSTMGTQTPDETMVRSSPTTPPCGACKLLRRRCTPECIFAPHFSSVQGGAAKFAAVQKVFGASNVSKLLSIIAVPRRHDAATTISYEAQARLLDPVYGCVSTIIALQQQVASLQAELAMVQTELMDTKFVYASALQTTQLLPNMNGTTLHPAYSNNSCVSTNLVNLSNFNNTPTFDLAMGTTPSSHTLDPLQLTKVVPIRGRR